MVEFLFFNDCITSLWKEEQQDLKKLGIIIAIISIIECCFESQDEVMEEDKMRTVLNAKDSQGIK